MIPIHKPAVVVASDLTVCFAKLGSKPFIALDKVGLLVDQNELVCLVGTNGSGKTTLLKVLAGVLPPSEGAIWFKEHALYRWSPHERCQKISRVTQFSEDGCAPRMTVEENLTLALLKGHIPTLRLAVRQQNRTQMIQYLESFGLATLLVPRLNNLASELSGGERQALVIAMAIIQKPELVLLDEHTASLDAANRKMVNELTAKLVHQQGITTVMVSHDLEAALQLATKLVILDGGRIVRRIQGWELRSTTVSDVRQCFNRSQRSGI